MWIYGWISLVEHTHFVGYLKTLIRSAPRVFVRIHPPRMRAATGCANTACATMSCHSRHMHHTALFFELQWQCGAVLTSADVQPGSPQEGAQLSAYHLVDTCHTRARAHARTHVLAAHIYRLFLTLSRATYLCIFPLLSCPPPPHTHTRARARFSSRAIH